MSETLECNNELRWIEKEVATTKKVPEFYHAGYDEDGNIITELADAHIEKNTPTSLEI